MQFALMIYQPHPFDPSAYSPEQYQRIAADYAAISATPGVTPGPPLGATAKAVTVCVRDGEAVTAEGPYAEAAHAVGGYALFEAESLEEAVALATRIPAARLGEAVEVRLCEVYWQVAAQGDHWAQPKRESQPGRRVKITRGAHPPTASLAHRC